MPKSKYPKSVQDLPEDDYSQWTAVYHSARDGGDSKETAAKKAWGAVKESGLQESGEDNPCWDGYEMVGMKTQNGKEVPNCVPKNESKKPVRISKTQLKEMVKRAVRNQLQEASTVRKRQMILDRFRTEANLSTYELLEDVLEFIDEKTWQKVLQGIGNKYGYRL